WYTFNENTWYTLMRLLNNTQQSCLLTRFTYFKLFVMAKNAEKSNLLRELHGRLVKLPKLFRTQICEECSWSEATFYRKMKGANTFSNAEKDKMKTIADNLLSDILSDTY